MNYDWHNFSKSSFNLWLSSDVIKRMRIIGFNSRSLNAECGNDFFGTMSHNGYTVVFDDVSEMCLTSDPGAGNYRASAHSHSTLDEPAAYKRFCEFLEQAKPGDCLLDIHTHMSGQYLDDGTLYEEFWKLSSGDIDTYMKSAKILADKRINYFAGITYICEDNRIGLAIVHYDIDSGKFYHVDKINLFDYASNSLFRLGASDGHQFIGYTFE